MLGEKERNVRISFIKNETRTVGSLPHVVGFRSHYMPECSNKFSYFGVVLAVHYEEIDSV